MNDDEPIFDPGYGSCVICGARAVVMESVLGTTSEGDNVVGEVPMCNGCRSRVAVLPSGWRPPDPDVE